MKILPCKNIPKFDVVNEIKLLNNSSAVDKLGRPVKLVTHKADESNFPQLFVTRLIDTDNNSIAYNKFAINKGRNTIDGCYMEVPNQGNRKCNGFGKILRLSTIMEMFENGFSKIRITSADDAVPFHLKYKFKPNLQCEDNDSLEDLLFNMSNIKEPLLEEQRIRSLLLLGDMNRWINAAEYHNIRREVTELVSDFLEVVHKENLPWASNKDNRGVSLYTAIPMELDKETVISNKNFFNSLFEKHEIDYTI